MPSFVGDMQLEDRKGRACLENVDLKKYRESFVDPPLRSKLKTTNVEDSSAACSDFRTMHAKKTAGSMNISGVHGGVCRHNCFSFSGSAHLDTVT